MRQDMPPELVDLVLPPAVGGGRVPQFGLLGYEPPLASEGLAPGEEATSAGTAMSLPGAPPRLAPSFVTAVLALSSVAAALVRSLLTRPRPGRGGRARQVPSGGGA